MFLGKKNLQLVQGLNKSYIELLDLYVHSRLGLESKFLLNKITQSSTYDHLYFIRLNGQPRNVILCYKGRLPHTIVLDGSQFIRRSF